ncbi:hypothetical protein AMS68_006044 [Peltaster fructicola]|uniref:HNH domain-containing protein n=1 Tax=Peltaster fructicola TaxID=286661 RepID=A0A6H0Y0J7_9PEZI|nr:hypothetical protein AMS68_006044 [Peltaster fructicola]
MLDQVVANNLDLFRDTLQPVIVQRLMPTAAQKSGRKRVKGRKNEIKPVQRIEDDHSAADLVDFIEYLAEEIFSCLPDELKSLTYMAVQNDSILAERYSLPLSAPQSDELVQLVPATVMDSLMTYSLLNDEADLDHFLEPIISGYISAATSTPPEYEPQNGQARPDGCEICYRTQLPLTYHHLIPRGVHEKVVKRGWHAEWELNKVAWLCRACHSFVHRIATNEELAKSLYSIELLLAREDVQKWAIWASRVRWKSR